MHSMALILLKTFLLPHLLLSASMSVKRSAVDEMSLWKYLITLKLPRKEGGNLDYATQEKAVLWSGRDAME